ncbi:MAG TPA: hypothetical protein PKD09_09380 [Aggregatilinea sp.]|uniref:hypothetical protein n=1 Tax=Aggregatilinea sp. TaxID=2806333 RepID=UPI002CCF781B|nr:hypothetical protein [Aggregatilinea sp.]HML21848.1 hypothetical protein [Aggregatilinea sp.]
MSALFDLDAIRTKAESRPAADDIEREHYPSDPRVVEFAVSRLWRPTRPRPIVLDPCAGSGVWGQTIKRFWPQAIVIGVDLPGVERPDGYDHWFAGDFLRIGRRMLKRGIRIDFTATNPPFSKSEEFSALTYELLRPDAWQIYYLRIAILAGQDRCREFWPKLPPRAVTTSAKRQSFSGNGRTDPQTEYALYIWQKGFTGFGTLLPSFIYDDPETWDWSHTWMSMAFPQQSRRCRRSAALSVVRNGGLAARTI